MKYLTASLFMAQPGALPLAGVSPLDVTAWIEEAEGAIDAYMGFDERNALGFALGQRVESQVWNPGSRRVNLSSFPVPVRSVDSFFIQYGQNPGDGSAVGATIPVNDVVLDDDYKYAEVITVAVVVAGLVPVLAFTGVIEPIARLTYTAGYAIAKSNWRCYPDPANPLIYHSRVPFWDSTHTVLVTANGVAATPSVNYEDGSLTFTGIPASPVRASFTHTIPDLVTQVTRKALRDVASDYFANSRGMAGADMARAATQTLRRQGTFRDPQTSVVWQSMLDPLKGVAITAA